MSVRLKELLNDSDKESVASSTEKYKYNHQKHNPPNLGQLQAQGTYTGRKELRDVNYIPASELDEEDAKREILFKFELLKKSYKDADIPEFNVHSDLNNMQKTYEISVRKLSLDNTVDTYKQYLTYGFMATEFIFGNWLGFDMQGFTQQQMVSMNSYEKLLIELGEKSYVPTGSKWPVELRLLFLIIINAAFFIISKMIMKKTGTNLINMMNNMNTPRQPEASKTKRKMKGPSIDIDDIPDLEEETK
jgi:hypothetical protein